MNKLIRYIIEPWRVVVAFDRHVSSIIPDKLYLKCLYRCLVGKKLNLENPTSFCEKMQWLKLYDKCPEYSSLVDKLLVRDHISTVLGEDYLFPMLGCWKSFDEINFDALPNQFVLKCNHDSGSTKVIRDKSSLTMQEIKNLKSFFTKRLKQDFFYASREYPYKGIEPYIFAEKLMTDDSHPETSIEDYKFFCFNGIPKIMFVATDRNTDCKFDFFDMEFNRLAITNIHPNSGKLIKKPATFEKMKEIAAQLSTNIPFVRIDLYEINGHIYFGEYTFFHGGGFHLFYPEEWEKKTGDWIKINNKT